MFSFEEKNNYFNYELIINIPSNGAEGRIDLIRITTGEEMILKTINDQEFCFPEVRGEMVLKKYEKLKEAGLPIVTEIKISKDEKQILMTDMTDGGKKIVIDKNKLFDVENKNILPKTILNVQELIEEIYEISQKAFESGVLLDYDAYSILFDPETETGNICLIDIGEHSYLIDNDESGFVVTKNSNSYLIDGNFIKYTEEEALENAYIFVKYLRKQLNY